MQQLAVRPSVTVEGIRTNVTDNVVKGTKSAVKQQYEVGKLSVGVTQNNLMFLPVESKGIKYSALLDSGASHNFICQSFLDQFNGQLPVCNTTPLEIHLADKSTVVSSRVVKLPITLAVECEREVQLYIVPQLNHGVILGMQWLKEYNPNINWKSRIITMTIAGKAIDIKCGNAKLPRMMELCTVEQLCQSFNASTDTLYIVRISQCNESGTSCGVGHPAQCNQADVVTSIDKLCAEFKDIFDQPGKPAERQIKHRIDLLNPKQPIKHHRQYAMSQSELDEVRMQIDDLLSKGWIRPSNSQYNHPILFVKKKDSSMRMCIDYRSLNENTIIDRYPLPRIDEILDRLANAVIFSKVDLRSGYHQVAIEPGHEHRTAFQSRYGLYEYTVLPFGLCNAPATFQRLLNDIFRAYLDKYITIFLDDILIFSNKVEEHVDHLRVVFSKLREHTLKAKRTKCEFGLPYIEYLGHVVSKEGVAVVPEKTRAIANCPAPTNVKSLQMFLGMCNYYSKFVRQYSQIAAPLYQLLHKDSEWQWLDKQQQAFNALKSALTNAPVLALPNFQLPFELETDASDVAVGGVLVQQGRPVAYFSKALTSTEQAYPVHDRELLAIILSCKRWRQYIAHQRTVVYTDHKPLTHIFTQTDLNKRQVRWLEKLADTPLSIQYRPGREQVVPDALSRIAVNSDLSSIIVEPSFLQRVSAAQFDSSDAEMSKFVALARSLDPDFRIVHRHGVPVVVRLAGRVEQVILPAGQGFRQLLLEECHTSPLAGHLGSRKVVNLLTQRVWWPKLRAEVGTFCRKCDVCARIKDPTGKPQGELQPLPVPEKRFHSWSLDFLTDLPVSHGCNTILTVVDRLTKYTRLIPCSMGSNQLSAAAVAKLMLSHIVRQFGVFKELVHDRDPRFIAAFWQEFWKGLGCKPSASTAFHPQSDGQTERQHRTVTQVLRAHCLEQPEQAWYVSLPLVEFAVNSTVNVSTGYSPFYLLYGEEVPLPIDHALLDDSRQTTAQELITHVQQVVRSAQSAMRRAQEQQKVQYDRRHKPTELQVGDWVYLSTKNLQLPGSRKLGPRFVGPMQVLKRVGTQAYKLDLPPALRQHHPVFHVALLRRAFQAPAPAIPTGPSRTSQPAGTTSKADQLSEDEYEVDRIVAERKHKYRVRWTGYDASEDSWISKHDLQTSAPAVVAAWKAQQQGS